MTISRTMNNQYGRIESPEEERLRLCNQTVTGKHFWHQIEYNKYWEWAKDKDIPIKARIDQCVACGIVNDIHRV